MHCTNDLRETLLSDQTFRTPGKHEDNVSKITQTHSHNNKGSDRPPSTPLQPQDPGTTNPFQWTSTGQKPLEGIGEGKEGGNQEETLPELMMFKPKGEYRVCALTVDNKDISLVIAPPNRNASI